MFDIIKEYAPKVAQSIIDIKTGPAAAVTTGVAVAARSDLEISLAIGAAVATIMVMILNGILQIVRIRREIKSFDEPIKDRRKETGKK